MKIARNFYFFGVSRLGITQIHFTSNSGLICPEKSVNKLFAIKLMLLIFDLLFSGGGLFAIFVTAFRQLHIF